jgi:CRISPR system Cascade subunit CasB
LTSKPLGCLLRRGDPLRGQPIPLDYAQLARQLYQAQSPGGMREVRQIWGRSFHARTQTLQSADTPNRDSATIKETS